MDGQRRIARPLIRAIAQRLMATLLRRRRWGRLFARGERLSTRLAARAGALAFLTLVIMQGFSDGGHLDYPGSRWDKLPGRMASVLGFAADDVRISGLKYHDAEAALTPLGVRPGGSLIGFDAANARKLLENMDWIISAKVLRLFPNQLEIALTEREPVAIWQRDGSHYVIDVTGAAISSLDPQRFGYLLLVTGEGAQSAIAELVNQLEAHSALKSRLLAAARVGQRRWTLHLDDGVTIALPEVGAEAAMAKVEALDQRFGLLSKGIKGIDLRLADRLTVTVAELPPDTREHGRELKVSQRR